MQAFYKALKFHLNTESNLFNEINAYVLCNILLVWWNNKTNYLKSPVTVRLNETTS